MKLAKYEDAIQNYRGAIKPDYAEAFNNIGTVFKALGKKSALDSFEKALSLRPDYVDALINMGVLKKIVAV